MTARPSSIRAPKRSVVEHLVQPRAVKSFSRPSVCFVMENH